MAVSASAQGVSDKYRAIWGDSVQMSIDRQIEKNRKADAVIRLKDAAVGTEVKVEQTSHEFIFGSNIFLYGQLDSPEKNRAYEATFGELFNSATLPFYWKTLEPVKGQPRYAADSPYEYRRPATDPIVDFCEQKGLHMKGHAMIYGIRSWGHPTWMSDDREVMEREFEAHIKELAKRYKGRIHNWDVVNECLNQANRGVMPDDYTYKSWSWAMKYFPKSVTFNSNECDMRWDTQRIRRYVEIVRDLVDRGARVDYMGIQMHILRPKLASAIAAGESDVLNPDKIWERLNILTEAERPIFISEVTVSATDDSEEGRAIQKMLAHNLYRIWFSHPQVAGITWWNMVDGGAVAGEPSYSGLFDMNMKRKPSYEALDNLINHEWKTRLSTKVDAERNISFRGFRGDYKITYTNRKGESVTIDYKLQ
ncbi:MAG: endo-1,4-beta-xylanase [Alistipes sp.]|nr:endo-1,4-beta-xylanase [Alistipes sp.]